jgi:hypothetical protein
MGEDPEYLLLLLKCRREPEKSSGVGGIWGRYNFYSLVAKRR